MSDEDVVDGPSVSSKTSSNIDTLPSTSHDVSFNLQHSKRSTIQNSRIVAKQIFNRQNKPEKPLSIEEVLKSQKSQKEKYLLEVTDASYQIIQSIFPTFVEVQVFQNEVPKNEEYVPWFNETESKNIKQTKSVSFHEILTEIDENNFVGIIGLPGAGKTMLCRRIARYSDLTCLYLPFMNLNFDPNYQLTLRQLLLDNNCRELNQETCETSFKWIVQNQKKCLIIMDGYDQANWSLVEKPPAVSYNQPQKIWDLVSNVLNKTYLPKCHILFTSRPHSMTTVPKSIKPGLIVYVLDLSIENTEKLFYAFAGDRADKLWKKLHAEAPQLVKLCLTPLMLQLIVKTCLSSSDISNISTMTRLFESIFYHLRVSEHTSYNDIQVIKINLAELAYTATKNGTVVVRAGDLKKVGLTPEIAQDLVIAQHTYESDSCKVFEGDETLFFLHQTIQEYLTAHHVYYAMSYLKFCWFVQTKLFISHWSVVRQFLYGIAFDLEKNSETRSLKKCLLKTQLIQKMKSKPIGRDLIELCSVARECADDEVTEMASLHFPTQALISNTPLNRSDAHSLALVLRGVNHKLEVLKLECCRINSETFLLISEAIRKMNGSVDCLDIAANSLSSCNVTNICSILHKTNMWLNMVRCFDNESDKLPWRSADIDETNQIKLTLNSLNNNNLKVFVDRNKPPLKPSQHK